MINNIMVSLIDKIISDSKYVQSWIENFMTLYPLTSKKKLSLAFIYTLFYEEKYLAGHLREFMTPSVSKWFYKKLKTVLEERIGTQLNKNIVTVDQRWDFSHWDEKRHLKTASNKVGAIMLDNHGRIQIMSARPNHISLRKPNITELEEKSLHLKDITVPIVECLKEKFGNITKN